MLVSVGKNARLVTSKQMEATMLRYCTRCVMPDTKPDLALDDHGVCSACRSFDARQHIDWAERRQQLDRLLNRYRCNGKHWDCVVPVSGGKDSHYQVIRMLEFGMTPLAVVATTCDLSEIGRRNIESIKRLGVDCIEMSPNPRVRAKLNRLGLTMVGDISWPEHAGIFTIPVGVALRYEVPLIIWGENSQNEYGGPAAAAQNQVLDRRWLEEFGGLLGLRVSDLAGMEGIEERHLLPYQYPSDADLKRVGVTGLFLGYFMPWDGLTNALIAQSRGFSSWPRTIEGSAVNYENLDNHQTGIHDYFKFLKFGFGRATDLACLHVRRGRLSRADAMNMVRVHDGRFPWTYLDKPLHKILEPLELTVEQFVDICDQFTNKRLFKTDSQGRLIKDKLGNLTKINDDNP